MFTGTLINDLFAAVERAERSSRLLRSENPATPKTYSVASRVEAGVRPPMANLKQYWNDQSSNHQYLNNQDWRNQAVNDPHGREERPNRESESKQLPEPASLSAADWNLCLLLVIHSQLVRALKPGNDFADAVDVDQIRAMRPPKKIGV